MAIPTFIFMLPFLTRFFFSDAKSKSGVVTRTDSDESEENCLIGVKPHPESSPEEERNSAQKEEEEEESQIEKPFSHSRKSSNSSSSSSSKRGHSSSSISEVQDEKSDDDQQKRKEFDALRTSRTPSSSSSSFSSLSSRGEEGTEEKQIKVIEDTKLLNPDCTQVKVQTTFDTSPDWKADLLTKGFDQVNVFMPKKKASVIKVNEDKGSRQSSSTSTSSSSSSSVDEFDEIDSKEEFKDDETEVIEKRLVFFSAKDAFDKVLQELKEHFASKESSSSSSTSSESEEHIIPESGISVAQDIRSSNSSGSSTSSSSESSDDPFMKTVNKLRAMKRKLQDSSSSSEDEMPDKSAVLEVKCSSSSEEDENLNIVPICLPKFDGQDFLTGKDT